jgi:uncharacterized membrane protein YdbT with pleckstrin-like domain
VVVPPLFYFRYIDYIDDGGRRFIPNLPLNDWEAVALSFLLFLILMLCYLQLVLKKYWYFITNQRCIIFSGFFRIKKRIILLGSITNVSIRQSFLDSSLGTSAVVINVPGMGISNGIVISGLTPESAEKISHLIGKPMRNARKN